VSQKLDFVKLKNPSNQDLGNLVTLKHPIFFVMLLKDIFFSSVSFFQVIFMGNSVNTYYLCSKKKFLTKK